MLRRCLATAPAFQRLRAQITHAPLPPHVDLFNATLNNLRRASHRADPVDLIHNYRILQQNNLLHFLNPSILGSISALLARSFSAGTLPESHLQTAEHMALLVATRRSTDALASRLFCLLKQNNSEAVIDLYQRFILASKVGHHQDHSAEQSTTRLAPDDADQHPHHSTGHINILLPVIAAHALRDSFHDAFHTYLQSTVNLHHSATQAFCKRIKHDPNLSQKLQLYVQRLNVARLVARSPSFSTHIGNLSRTTNVASLVKLYGSVIDAFSGPDAYLAPHPSAISLQRVAALTDVGWAAFAVAFLKCRRRDLASEVQSHMSQFGVQPGVSMYTSLIDTYDTLREIDNALDTWNTMVARGITPDPLTYRAMISALFNSRRPEEALQTFRLFQEKALSDCSHENALSVYNTVLHGFLSLDRDREANGLLRDMESDGPTPDLVSYNTFLAYYGRRADFKSLATVVNQMASHHVTGDVFSFSTILSALLKVGREDATDLLFTIMRKQGIEPNVATYSSIIDHQMRQNDEKSFGAALRILQLMEQDPTLQPNEVTYTSILAGLFRCRWLAPEESRQWRTEILGRMKKRGIELNAMTYHILIKASLSYPHPEGLEEALSYYRDMRHRKIPYNHTTWHTLLTGLRRRGEWEVADEIIKDMYISGTQPSGGLLGLVYKIKRRERVEEAKYTKD